MKTTGILTFLTLALLLGQPGFTETFTSTGWPEMADLSHFPEKAHDINRLWEEGKKRRAMSEAKGWVKDEKDSPYPYVVTATLYFQKGKYKKALKYCKKAIKKRPQTGEAYFWRGRAYEALKKPLEAANEYRAALYAKEEFMPAKERLDQVLAQIRSTPE